MRRLRRLTGLVGVLQLGALATPAPAWAQHAGHSDKERAAQARQKFEAGKKAYNIGDFDNAIELWKQAYEYRDDPIFLYNVAQAYRQKGDAQKAIFFYRAYLREEPRARNRNEVEARIAELQKQVDSQPPPTPEPEPPRPVPASEPATQPATPTPSAPTAEAAEADTLHPGKGMKITGLVTGGVGVAALAAGVVFTLRAKSIQSDLETAARSGQPWSKDLVDKEATGRTSSTLGLVGIGVGAAALVTGVTLFWLGARKDSAAARETEVSVVPLGTTGGALSVTFTY
jgi:tetratricopeptide (TPR) repeat protein